MQLHIIDGLYEDIDINSVIEKSTAYQWGYERSDNKEDYYWSINIFGKLYSDEINASLDEFNKKEIKNLWDIFSNKFKVPLSNLDACYLNGMTHGTEAFPHIDFREPGNITCILYICNEWNAYWGGETVFFDKEFVPNNPAHEVFYTSDIVKSVLPRYNRMVIFDGNITHAVRPISKSYKGLRKTLMFKIKDMSIDQLMENYRCK